MLFERPVTCFARDTRVFAGAFDLQNFGVARFARLMSGVPHRARRLFRNEIAPIVAIFSEALRNRPRPEHQKDHDSRNEHCGHTKEVLPVVGPLHHGTAGGN